MEVPFVKLQNELKLADSLEKKIGILNREKSVQDFFKKDPFVMKYIENKDKIYELIAKEIAAIGQADRVFANRGVENAEQLLQNMFNQLVEIENFYESLGGIVGYQATFLALLSSGAKKFPIETTFHVPEGLDLTKNCQKVDLAVRRGIENLPNLVEIFPVGGAGDRLDLHDEFTGIELPAGLLKFAGKTLLEGLVRDVQAKEYLFYKLFGTKIAIPIILMTSAEKKNHEHILKLLEEKRWFGKDQNDFFIVKQPMIPVLTQEGNWAMQDYLTLHLKPGGHGIIWKMIADHGGFFWLKSLKKTKALIRQINNPIAGVDSGLLSLLGYGAAEGKIFGFACCPSRQHAAEGVDVLVETKKGNKFCYGISNVEYVDLEEFKKKHSLDHANFPANTNILFADLDAVESVVKNHPLPGLLLNLKTDVPYLTEDGIVKYMKGGRIESTMQNISDFMFEEFSKKLEKEEFRKLKTFVTWNERLKTISVTKTSRKGEEIFETPEGAFYDLMILYTRLFSEHCSIKMPSVCKIDEYLSDGPNVLIFLNPALGPLFSVIAQKIRNGEILENSYVNFDIAELEIDQIFIQGSLLIQSKDLYSGNCSLKGVKVLNKGMERVNSNIYWKDQIMHKEALHIILNKNSEFVAENVIFEGPFHIEVPRDCKITASMKNGKVNFFSEKAAKSSWRWQYSFNSSHQIALTRVLGFLTES